MLGTEEESSSEANPYHEFRTSATHKGRRHLETSDLQPCDTPPSLCRGNTENRIKTTSW